MCIHLTILNVYTSNHIASKYRKQNLTDLKGEINKSIIIFGDFNSISITTGRIPKKRTKE